jgi:hypothetical protein
MIKQILFLMLLTSIANATDILLTWETPTERKDGSAIETIDRFNLYTTIDNVLQSAIEVSATATSFQLPEVEAGTYTFQISTVERHIGHLDADGNVLTIEGALSDPVSVNIADEIIAKPAKFILTIQAIE